MQINWQSKTRITKTSYSIQRFNLPIKNRANPLLVSLYRWHRFAAVAIYSMALCTWPGCAFALATGHVQPSVCFCLVGCSGLGHYGCRVDRRRRQKAGNAPAVAAHVGPGGEAVVGIAAVSFSAPAASGCGGPHGVA